MQLIYSRAPMLKSDFNKVALMMVMVMVIVIMMMLMPVMAGAKLILVLWILVEVIIMMVVFSGVDGNGGNDANCGDVDNKTDCNDNLNDEQI